MEKVTCFILNDDSTEILLFEHENSGIQIPAGTVEENEDIRTAAIREASEETGIDENMFYNIEYLGEEIETFKDVLIIDKVSTIYARPRDDSFDWAKIRRGIGVKKLRSDTKFTQIEYIEWDKYPNGEYITYRICGWTQNENLTDFQKRHFFVLRTKKLKEKWSTNTDCHTFTPFWNPINKTDKIVYPQSNWIKILDKYLN